MTAGAAAAGTWSRGLRRAWAGLRGDDEQGQREQGSAIVEFVFLAVLMIVPLIYLVMVLARVQAGAYAVTGASREAGRAYVTADQPAQADGRAQAAADLALADQDFPPTPVTITCDGTPCLRPEGKVTVVATVRVPMPLVPTFFARIVPTSIPVTATHVATVDRFRGP